MASPTPPPESRSRADVSGLDRPAAAACTECRRKHVRCDATTPTCLRCASTGAQCCYLPSRRGLKRRACDVEGLSSQNGRSASECFLDVTTSLTTPISTLYPQTAPTVTVENASWTVSRRPSIDSTGNYGTVTSPASTVPQRSAGTGLDHPPDSASRRFPTSSNTIFASNQNVSLYHSISGQDDDYLLNSFYTNFHAAHPFLVPRTMFAAQNYPSYLCKVVQLIGSQYAGMPQNTILRESAGLAMVEASLHEDQGLHLVQARLLFSIALHARNEIKESVSVLGQAVSLALAIGLHTKDFCSDFGPSRSMQVESIRRTWWELYVTDGFMAALQRKTKFLCHEADPDMPLPCEESMYIEGSLLEEPYTVAQFGDRIFADEDIAFSSCSYRIEAIRNLARVLSISDAQEIEHEQVHAIDTSLAAWLHHLPPEKACPLNTRGEVDQMLFQAHMLIHYTIIYLHFPRSHLVASVPATSDIIRQRHLVPFSTRTMHGVKAIEASKQLSNLAAIHSSVTKHTPFFIFAIVFGAIVQLSDFTLQRAASRGHHRDRVSLITGVLKTLSPIWPFSYVVVRKLTQIAGELFGVRTKTQRDGSGIPQERLTDPALSSSVATIADMDYWMNFFDTDYIAEVGT